MKTKADEIKWMNGHWGPDKVKERQGRTRTLPSLMKGERGELRG